MKNNIAYHTDQLARYFSTNRVTWQQFYESERTVIEQLHPDYSQTILDVGCGGLGLALRDEFGVVNYTGVEINSEAADAARKMNSEAHIYCGDILRLVKDELREKSYSVVFSLSCIDWNVQFNDMLAAVWSCVQPGGSLVATFRLTAGEGCDDISRSYQYINFDGEMKGEKASYVVLNANTLIQQLNSFDPSAINAYGYWGTPSSTAVTPYERFCFSAFSVRKRKDDDADVIHYGLNLPSEILDSVNQ